MSENGYTLEELQRDPVLQNLTKAAAAHMVSAAVVAIHPDEPMNSSGYWLVAGYKKMPEFCDDISKIADADGNAIYHTPKDIEDERLRSPALFHPHAFAARLTPETRTSALTQFSKWMRETDIIGARFEGHGLVLPKVLRTEEKDNLIQLYRDANTPGIGGCAQEVARKRMRYYFMEQESMQKPRHKRKAAHYKYIRSDSWLQKKKMLPDGEYFREFGEKKQYGQQILPVDVLLKSGADLIRMDICNDYWLQIEKELPRYPFIYLAREKMTYANDPDAPGADALDKYRNWKMRRVIYVKRVDYPIICGWMHKGRITNQGVHSPDRDIDLKQVPVGEEPEAYSARLIPVEYMDDFFKRVSADHVPCHIDLENRFLDADENNVAVVVLHRDAERVDQYLKSVEERQICVPDINKKPDYRRSLGYWEAEAEATKDSLRQQMVPQREIDQKTRDELMAEAR